MLEFLHQTLFAGTAFLFISNAIILFLRSQDNKARKTLAAVILAWGIVYLASLINLQLNNSTAIDSLYRPYVLIAGNIFITIMLLFPMQAIVPGWLSWKKTGLIFAPLIAITAIYHLGIHLMGETPIILKTYTDVGDNIGKFNVWYRFVFLLSNIVYMYTILRWLYKQEKKYTKWKNDNFSDQDYVDISWMRPHNYLMCCILFFYFGVLFIGGRITIILHTIVVMFSFSYLFYKGLFYKSSYPEDYFSEDATEYEQQDEPFAPILTPTSEIIQDENEETSFESKLPTYINVLKNWMETEKPYLYKDFKLTDVARVLMLNRTYLSRVFNEGFELNFCEVVRAYRIAYSKEILKKDPAMPLYKVASLSGFNSDSTFIRAFKQVTGITPSQYKQNQDA